MKRILTLILLAIFVTTAGSQQPNERLRRLERLLSEKGAIGVSHRQNNTSGRGITHYLNAGIFDLFTDKPNYNFDERIGEATRKKVIASHDSIMAARRQQMSMLLDSIRLTFALLAGEAAQSYSYEYHMNGIDTIKYTWASGTGEDTILSLPIGGRWQSSGAREAVYFDYSGGYNEMRQGREEQGQYCHMYTVPTGIRWDNMKSFDVEAFEAHIAPVLKAFKKLKGAKVYPVYWRHDEGFRKMDDFIFHISRLSAYSDNKHTGLTTGTHYFIPAEHREEADALYKQLAKLALDYVSQHPEQPYEYRFSSRFPYLNITELVEGSGWKSDTDYSLRCMRDDDGYHILCLNTQGELWIPRDWPKLKSYINGEMVYRKK